MAAYRLRNRVDPGLRERESGLLRLPITGIGGVE
jgi:hypothetical protein